MSEFAGTLRERITIEMPVGTRNAMGLQQPEWAELCRCLASVAPEGAGAQAEAMTLSAMPRFRVTVRKRDGIAIDQRVRWGERLLTIRQLIDDPRARDRILMRCEEVRGQ